MSPESRGVLASVGIIKGVPFNPDSATREALTRALEDAPKMIFADRVAGRADGNSTRVRMSISETRVRWTVHFWAISSSFERCSWVSRPANSRSLSMWSSIPSLVSQSGAVGCVNLTVAQPNGNCFERPALASRIQRNRHRSSSAQRSK